MDVMNLRDYWDKLNAFDWYYQFSDDSRAYNKADAEHSKLLEISKESDQHKLMYSAFRSHNFTGAPWKEEKTPKPERPESDQDRKAKSDE